MGPTCKHVAPLIGNVLKQVRSVSFADWISCTNKDWLRWSHRAEKKKRDNVSHGPHVHIENLPGSEMRITLRVKEIINRKRGTHRKGKRGKRRLNPPGGEKAKKRPSHNGRAGLRDDPLQHFRRNTRNRQVRCNKCKQLGAPKRRKFEYRFSNAVSVREKDASVDPVSLLAEYAVLLLILVEVEGQQELLEIERE